MKRALALALYYGFARYLPTQPATCWRMAYSLSRCLVGWFFGACGEAVVIKRMAYFGAGKGIRLGARAQFGHAARIDHNVTIDADVVMRSEVIIMTVGHAYADPDIPTNLQGALGRRPVTVGNDLRIGRRVLTLPGVEIGDGAVIGACAVVDKSIPAFAVADGSPARVVKWRGSRSPASSGSAC